jgi:hypothetical protein
MVDLEDLHVSADRKTVTSYLSACPLRYVKVSFPDRLQEMESVSLFV